MGTTNMALQNICMKIVLLDNSVLKWTSHVSISTNDNIIVVKIKNKSDLISNATGNRIIHVEWSTEMYLFLYV